MATWAPPHSSGRPAARWTGCARPCILIITYILLLPQREYDAPANEGLHQPCPATMVCCLHGDAIVPHPPAIVPHPPAIVPHPPARERKGSCNRNSLLLKP